MKRRNNYICGIAYIYRETESKTDFNAKKNIKSLKDLAFVLKLAYDEKSVRQQDAVFAEQSGCTLSLKIVVPLVDGIDNTCKVVINRHLYDIWHLDRDRINGEIHLYLEGVREIAE